MGGKHITTRKDAKEFITQEELVKHIASPPPNLGLYYLGKVGNMQDDTVKDGESSNEVSDLTTRLNNSGNAQTNLQAMDNKGRKTFDYHQGSLQMQILIATVNIEPQ